MPIYIANGEAERLARDLAASTGETITDVVIHALRERRDRLAGPSPETRLATLRAASKDIASMIRPNKLDADDLYDEAGAPS